MITKKEATALKQRARYPIWTGESFAQAVMRLGKELRECAEGTPGGTSTGFIHTNAVDGLSAVFNPAHVPALLGILKAYGFDDAKVNDRDNFRIEIHW